MPKGEDLTLKQRKWLHLYLKCGNATEAAIKVYKVKTRESAAQIGYENLRKLDYSDFLEEAGITDDLLQKKIIEGLEANRVISANVTVKSDDPKVKTKQATARDVDFIDVPDFMARHKYLETALKLKKRMIEKKEDTDPQKIVVGIEFIIPKDERKDNAEDSATSKAVPSVPTTLG